MTPDLLLDQFFIEVRVPQAMPAGDVAAVRRALRASGFLPRLRRALRPVFAAHPALAAVRVRVSR